jgi:hypothetical protein
MNLLVPTLAVATAALAVYNTAWAQASPRNTLEIDAVWASQDRNTVQLPNDATGTRFSIRDLTGDARQLTGRITYTRALSPKSDLVLLAAPLELSGTGVPGQAINFEGASFAAGTPTTANYKFNSYRATWRYALWQQPDWTFKVGFTGKIRDASIGLSQPGLSAVKDNIGFVPLLHLYGERKLGERWTLIGDFDGLAGGPGRAIDLGVRARYQINPTWGVQAGWRMLDGGVDNREQYNFARFTSFNLGIAARF